MGGHPWSSRSASSVSPPESRWRRCDLSVPERAPVLHSRAMRGYAPSIAPKDGDYPTAESIRWSLSYREALAVLSIWESSCRSAPPPLPHEEGELRARWSVQGG